MPSGLWDIVPVYGSGNSAVGAYQWYSLSNSSAMDPFLYWQQKKEQGNTSLKWNPTNNPAYGCDPVTGICVDPRPDDFISGPLPPPPPKPTRDSRGNLINPNRGDGLWPYPKDNPPVETNPVTGEKFIIPEQWWYDYQTKGSNFDPNKYEYQNSGGPSTPSNPPIPSGPSTPSGCPPCNCGPAPTPPKPYIDNPFILPVLPTPPSVIRPPLPRVTPIAPPPISQPPLPRPYTPPPVSYSLGIGKL